MADNVNLRQRLLHAAILIATSLFLLRDVISGGIPTFRHDWNWPVAQVAPANIIQFGTASWTPIDLGAPNVYPAILPLLGIEAFLVRIFGASYGLDVLLLALYITAGAGCYATVKALGGRNLSATVAALAYTVSPAMFDQLVAGHIGDLSVLAALPWVLAAIFQPKASLIWVGIGMVAAVASSVQLQGLALECILLSMGFAILRSAHQRKICALLVVTAIIANIESLTSFALPVTYDVSFIQQERAVESWEMVQSAPFGSALLGRGYFAGYDELGGLAGRIAPLGFLAISGIIGLGLLAIKKRSRESAVLVAAYVAGVVTLSSLKGPGASIFSWLFSHVAGTSLFRELFHAAPLVSIPLAVGLGVVFDFALTQRLAFAIVMRVVVFVGIAELAQPSLAGTSKLLRHFEPSVAESAYLSAISKAPGYFRFAIFPGRQPYRAENSIGVDAASYYAQGSHWPIFAYFPLPPLSLAADLWASGDLEKAERVYERVSVGSLLERSFPEPASALVLERRERPANAIFETEPVANRTIALSPSPLVRGDRLPELVSGDFSTLASRSDSRVLAFMRLRDPLLALGLYVRGTQVQEVDAGIAEGCLQVEFPSRSLFTADPNLGWVDGWRYGPYAPAIDYSLTPTVVSSALPLPALPFNVQPYRILALKRGSAQYLWYSPRELRSGAGGLTSIALGVARNHQECKKLSGTDRTSPIRIVSFERLSAAHLSGSFVSGKAPGSVIFTDAYDDQWQLRVDGHLVAANMHFHADGFANGWAIRAAAGEHHFDIAYLPDVRFRALLLMQYAVYAGAIAVFGVGVYRSR